MTFLDDLTLVLDLLVLVACVVFYTGFMTWLEMYRKDRTRAVAQLRAGSILIGMLGVVIFLIALWGEEAWPLAVVLPNGTNVLAAYDLFFFDSLMLLSLLLIGWGVLVYAKLPTHYIGMFGVVVGFAIGFYGYRAYNIGLTLDPLETFLLYLAFGGMAILSYPVTLYVDWFVLGPVVPGTDPLPSDPTPRYGWMWTSFIWLFLIVVVLAGIAALWYGFDAAWAHLASPP